MMNLDSLATTPTSIQQPFPLRQWAQLHFDILDLFSKHFPSDNKLFTIAYQTHSSQARLFLQHSILKRNKDRKPNIMTQEVLHFQIRVANHSLLWYKLTPETIKVHYTFGIPLGSQYLGGQIWKLYASVSTTRKLINSSFKIGLLGRMTDSARFMDLRLRYNVSEFSNEQYFYCKGGWDWGRLAMGLLTALDIRRRLLQKNDVKIGYQLGQNSWIGSSLEVNSFRNYKINYWRLGGYFDLLRFSYVHRFQADKWLGGLQYEYNLESSQTNKIEAVIQCRPSQKGLTHLKARINSNLQMALAGSYSLLEEMQCNIGLLWGRKMHWKWQPTSVSFSVNYGMK